MGTSVLNIDSVIQRLQTFLSLHFHVLNLLHTKEVNYGVLSLNI